ncbi:hypothetical protein PsYK624_159090 [Phanerochaete sordida]|uniref:N-acetyltransferase domain-containing protein n=1 Tax=Phanerochaete sordida TaxID=48140 RepID=A0A9P3GRB6_9APHY|nr:hypothetical protein PsYK624_159090 [Phanerochaete sordida]
MPSVGADFSIDVYTSSSDLPSLVWDTFRRHPCDSNIIFPHAEQSREQERRGEPSSGIWITCTTSERFDAPTVDFVLSCTEGSLGRYPVFIFTTLSSAEHDREPARRRLRALARALAQNVRPERVFSVFAPEQITRTFATLWTGEVGVGLDLDPAYYAAKFTQCTAQSFRPRSHSVLPGVSYDLRLARDDDAVRCAELCYGFAQESEPFLLSAEDALREAKLMISKAQLWVHEIAEPGKAPEIASIVAVTRTSDSVAAITKVYTNPRWRQRRCAERLVRRVCKHLLKSKEKVVLYVAHNNPAAAKVYDRVGFLGLSPGSAPVLGVDSWLELGFDRNLVTLGHW